MLGNFKQIGSAAASRTVNDLYLEYMDEMKDEWRITSYEKVQRRLEDKVLPYIGEVQLDQLDAATLRRWKRSLSRQDLSIRTKRTIFSALRAMLNYGTDVEYFDQSPLAKIKNFKDKDFTPSKDKLQYYTVEQFEQYIAVAHRDAVLDGTTREWGYYVFFMIAYYTGMRKGEINALKWTDIDGDIINVRRSISQKVKGVPVTETLPKTKSSYRELQMPLPLIKILEEHKLRYKEIGAFSTKLRICGGDRCLCDTTIENRNKHYCAVAGLQHIRIHDFRHSHASLLANEGINIQEIARRLGHSDIEETWKTYAHLYPREEERAVRILNKVQLRH